MKQINTITLGSEIPNKKNEKIKDKVGNLKNKSVNKRMMVERNGLRCEHENDETTSADVRKLGERIRNKAPREDCNQYSDCREKKSQNR